MGRVNSYCPSSTHQHGVIFESHGYCQIVSRTWNQQTTIDGYPLLLNDFRYKNIWKEAKEIVYKALELDVPNTWVSRQEVLDLLGTKPPSPEYWLPQLIKK